VVWFGAAATCGTNKAALSNSKTSQLKPQHGRYGCPPL
jgi:hypothetical protein